MSARPFVSVQGSKNPTQVTLPVVLSAPIRLDVVQTVFRDLNKNRRQAYAVYDDAGHQTSAESWGTGRAVARIPRVAGGGTSRSGQGAFGNMCRGGRMFAPTKTWRRWHRKVSVNQRRYALVSALAATAVPSLVLARGHKIEQIPEVPLVVSTEKLAEITKTSAAVKLLQSVGAFADVTKAKDSTKVRAGKGKYRNRRHVQRRGPLVVADSADKVDKAFRNLPGVEIANVERLNLLQVAPGGHVGRFVIWTQNAFNKLDQLYGTYTRSSAKKTDYTLPRPLLANPDITRVINSDEVQSKLKAKMPRATHQNRKKNPLKNLGVLLKLNPYAKTARRRAVLESQKASRAQAVDAKRAKTVKDLKKRSKKANAGFVKVLHA